MKYDLSLFLTVFIVISLNAQTALHFDGVNDYVNLDPIASSMDTLTEFTIEFQVKFELTNNLDYSAFFAVNSSSYGNVFLIRAANGSFDSVSDGAIVYINDSGNQYISGSSPIGDNECHHIAFTYNNTICKLFVDGNLEAMATHTITLSASNLYSLGQEYDNTTNPLSNMYEGHLDELRIWSEAKDDEEIPNLMSLIPTTTTPQLLHHFKLNDGIINANNMGLTTCSNSSNPSLNGELINFSLIGNQSNYVSSTCLQESYLLEIDTALCFGPFISPFGDVYEESGYYLDTISIGGNDTILQLTLEISGEDMSTEVFIDNSGFLWSLDSVSTYQWFHCEGESYSLLPGETNQSILPINNGSYAVVLTHNNCTDTSECITVKGVDIKEFSKDIKLYPNPSQGQVYIQGLENEELYMVRIFSQLGKILDEKSIKGHQNMISLPRLNGYYMIQVLNVSSGESIQLPVVIR